MQARESDPPHIWKDKTSGSLLEGAGVPATKLGGTKNALWRNVLVSLNNPPDTAPGYV